MPVKPDMKDGDFQRLVDQLIAKANQQMAGEGTVAVNEQRGEDGQKELFLTIENTIEDRAEAYVRLLRKRQVLRKAREG
jgi:ribosomal protein L17